MAEFENVGTFDAGIISSGGQTGGAAPGVSPIMDAAGVASGQAFLVSQLEKRDARLREPLTSVTYPRDIVVRTGGGWVDFISAQSVGYGVAGGSGDGPIQAGGANGLPIVQADLDKGTYKAHVFAVALRIMWVDMQKANHIGRSLDSLLQNGVRLTYDKHMDENVYLGFPRYKTTGLLNNRDDGRRHRRRKLHEVGRQEQGADLGRHQRGPAHRLGGGGVRPDRHAQSHPPALPAVQLSDDNDGHGPGDGDAFGLCAEK